AQIGELAGAAAGQDDLDAAFDHPVDMASEGALIEGIAVSGKGRAKGNADSLEVLHFGAPAGRGSTERHATGAPQTRRQVKCKQADRRSELPPARADLL